VAPGTSATFKQLLKRKTVPTGDGDYITLREERMRLSRAKRELKEIEVAKRRGFLISLDHVEREMTDLVLTTKALRSRCTRAQTS
jgi:hypothetical protein